jgi:predicted ABC-type ATPase
MKKLYIISGCNGAGKTTASYTVLPEMLGCKEFDNSGAIFNILAEGERDEVNVKSKLVWNKLKEDYYGN